VTARLIFVGTGGGAHVDRAHQCIAIEFAPDDVMLLDASGGFEVLRQLKHAGIDLPAIRSIFVSHRHSDHIGGLEPLLLHVGLQALATGRPAKELVVYGHPATLQSGQTLLEYTASSVPRLFKMTGQRLRWEPLQPGERLALSRGRHFTPFTVDHEPPGDTCLGCRVELEQGGRNWSIVYSGDTRPSHELQAQAGAADVLIHEAGGVDASAATVHLTGHSTAGDAARLAAKADAKRLFLTHLPQEEIVEQVLDEARRFYTGPVVIPRDLDTFDLAQLVAAP
jgi:ribonuclease Z